MDWEAWEACLSLGRIVYFALGRFITDLSLPESIRVAGMIRAVPILFMKRCFNASFLDSFSLGYTGVSFTNGKEIMLSHNTLGQEHLKRQANRSLMETNNQHGRTKILIFLHTHTHTHTHRNIHTRPSEFFFPTFHDLIAYLHKGQGKEVRKGRNSFRLFDHSLDGQSVQTTTNKN